MQFYELEILHIFPSLIKVYVLQTQKNKKSSTGLYWSCAALASFSGTFDLILFQAVNFEFIAEKVWFAYFKDTQTN